MKAKQRSQSRVPAQLAAIDRAGTTMRKLAAVTPLGRVAVGFSHVGRGGLVWHALAPCVIVPSRREGRISAAAASSAATATAFGLSVALARALARPRPCHEGARALVPCPSGGSFPSDQAAASFAAAAVLSAFDPKLRTALQMLAASISASRVVAGVHHPSDIIAGAFLGAGIGRVAQTIADIYGASDN